MKTKIFSILMILLLTMSLFPQIASAEDKETWTITVDANGGVFADGTKSFSFTLPKGKNAVEAEAEYTIDQLTVPTIPDNDDLAFIGFSLKNDEWVDVDWWTVYASDEDTTLYAVYRPGGSFWWQNDLNEDGSLYYYMNNSGIMSVMGEGEVNDLYDHPFAKTTVKTLYIEGNVYGIGTKALEQLDSLETLYLGRNVSTLERYALTYCDLLKEIIVAEDNPYLKTVNGVLYSKDGKILYRLPHNGTESLSVPDGVEEIGIDAIGDVLALKNAMLPASVKTINQEAFDGCKNLESISFSKSVSTIGRNAFNHCDNLRDVYFDGSINDWNRISIEENETLLKANIHFSPSLPLSIA